MKRILTYSLFESDEYDDEAPEGFLYSESNIIDFLQDLMDNLDFEIEKYSNVGMIKKLYLDEVFHDVGGLNKLTDSVWTGWEVNLIKSVSEKTDFIW